MKGLLIILSYFICIQSFSQDFEWTKTFGSNLFDRGYCSALSKNGEDIYISGVFNASISFGAYSFIDNDSTVNLFIAKIDKHKNVIWAKCLRTSKQGGGSPYKITLDSYENIYLTGFFSDTLYIDTINKIISNSNQNNSFLIKVDSASNYQWAKQGFATLAGFTWGQGVTIDNNNNCYALAWLPNTGTFNTENLSYYNANVFLIKYNLNGILQWVKPLNIGKSNMVVYNLKYNNSKLYVVGILNDSVTIGATKFKSSNAGGNSFTLITDTNGTTQKFILSGNNCIESYAFDISFGPNGSYYLTGSYYGNAQFNNFTLRPNNTNALPYFARFDKNDSCIWVKSISGGLAYLSGQPRGIDNFSNNFIYATGWLSGDGSFDQFKTFQAEGYIFIAKLDSNGNFIWAQRTGSSIYQSYGFGLNVDTSGTCYVVGDFWNTLILKNDTFISQGSNDIFLTKINDIGIYLDSINPTSYCTGDSIKIPYRTYGNFDTANYISVNLSDTSGKFDSIFYTLRTIKFKQGGDTIACKLPDTLLTSSHYKIKVFTTVNHVSNFDNNTFYSIYTKPVVSAGNDTGICTGASVQLNATANSVCSFLWQPSTGLNDSTIANPIAHPMVNTTYIVKATNPAGCYTTDTIIITTIKKPAIKINNDTAFCQGGSVLLQAMRLNSDSVSYYHWIDTLGTILGSNDTLNVTPIATTKYRLITANVLGCTDTQSVKIIVYGNLKITNIKDTTICNGRTLALNANGTGGDTALFNFSLYNGATLLQNNHNGLFSITPLTTNTYSIILSGGCTVNDTLDFFITVRDHLKIGVNTTDTVLCYGSSFSVKANATGGDSLNYSFTLYNIENSSMVSNTTGIFNVTPNATTHYNLRVSDGCTLLNDSIDVIIRIIPSLSNKLINDTIVCLGSTVNYIANPQGGDSTNYSYAWWSVTDNLNLSNTNILNTVITKPQTIVLQISDGRCNNYGDTFDIDVLPDFNSTLQFKPDSGCIPVTLQLTLPAITTLHSYQYIGALDPGDGSPKIRQTITTNQAIPDMYYSYTKAGTFSASFTLYNKLGNIICNPVIQTITVFPKPVAAFQPIPLKTNILRPTILFKNNSLESDAFVWYFGDGTQTQTTGLTDVQNKYSDTGTFNIMLVATNAIGCSDTAYGKITVEDSFTCFIPDAFSPNHDKTNETFAPVCSNTLYYTMAIYDRWGTIIYQSPINEKFPSWDGSINGTAVPEGIFIYMITARDATKKLYNFKGTVRVIR